MLSTVLLALVAGVSSANAIGLLKSKASDVSSIVKIGSKIKKSKVIKFKSKGRTKSLRRVRLRLRNPAVFRLLKKTERAASSYRARGKGGLPLGCGWSRGAIACWHNQYFCWVGYSNGELSATCGDNRNELLPMD